MKSIINKKLVEVLTGVKHLPIATYYIDIEVKIGTIVLVPFGKKTLMGIVFRYINSCDLNLIKNVISVYPIMELCEEFVNYIYRFSYYNIISTSYFVNYLQNLLPKKPMKVLQPLYKFNLNELNEEQKLAYESIKNSNKVNVLWGVTGSGKTEVFFHLIMNIVKNNGKVLVLFPEIALSNNMVERFEKAFGVKPLVWNSQCKNKSNFFAIQSEGPLIVLGSRCALLLPFRNLQLIILDEEHDRSYKQSNQYAYSARNMSILRSKIQNTMLVLSSATISVETYYKIQQGDFNCVRLRKRHSELSNPKITINRVNDELLSEYTITKCREALSKNQQIFFYLNRKGYAFVVKCKKCNNRLTCQACETNLVLHKYPFEHLLCHTCGKKYDSRQCLMCKSVDLFSCGVGIDQLKEYVEKIFSVESIVLFGDNVVEEIINIAKYSIIIGTQVLAKGHNFPKLSLVVMVNVDNGGYDFRSSETNLQTLYQVAGRAGRGKMDSSEVIIQTYKNVSQLEYLKSLNYEEFLQHELAIRKKWNLPPFIRLIAIRFIRSVNIELINELKRSGLFIRITDSMIYNNRTSVILFISVEKFTSCIQFFANKLNNNEILIDVDPQEII